MLRRLFVLFAAASREELRWSETALEGASGSFGASTFGVALASSICWGSRGYSLRRAKNSVEGAGLAPQDSSNDCTLTGVSTVALKYEHRRLWTA